MLHGAYGWWTGCNSCAICQKASRHLYYQRQNGQKDGLGGKKWHGETFIHIFCNMSMIRILGEEEGSLKEPTYCTQSTESSLGVAYILLYKVTWAKLSGLCHQGTYSEIWIEGRERAKGSKGADVNLWSPIEFVWGCHFLYGGGRINAYIAILAMCWLAIDIRHVGSHRWTYGVALYCQAAIFMVPHSSIRRKRRKCLSNSTGSSKGREVGLNPEHGSLQW